MNFFIIVLTFVFSIGLSAQSNDKKELSDAEKTELSLLNNLKEGNQEEAIYNSKELFKNYRPTLDFSDFIESIIKNNLKPQSDCKGSAEALKDLFSVKFTEVRKYQVKNPVGEVVSENEFKPKFLRAIAFGSFNMMKKQCTESEQKSVINDLLKIKDDFFKMGEGSSAKSHAYNILVEVYTELGILKK